MPKIVSGFPAFGSIIIWWKLTHECGGSFFGMTKEWKKQNKLFS